MISPCLTFLTKFLVMVACCVLSINPVTGDLSRVTQSIWVKIKVIPNKNGISRFGGSEARASSRGPEICIYLFC